jgi:hypothetical protein
MTPIIAAVRRQSSLSENIPSRTFDWKRSSSATRSTVDKNSIDEEKKPWLPFYPKKLSTFGTGPTVCLASLSLAIHRFGSKPDSLP